MLCVCVFTIVIFFIGVRQTHVLCLVVPTEKPGGRGAPGDAKFVIKSSTIRISVKKPASNDSNSAKLEVNKPGTQTNNTSTLPGVASDGNNLASTGLQSLFQSYDSEDD